MKRWLNICLPIFCVILLFGVGAAYVWFWFNRESMLTDAAATGNLPAVRLLYYLGADLNGSTTSDSGEQDEPAFLVAIENGHEDVVRFFIDHHADLDMYYADEITALGLALKLKDYSMVELLLSNGARLTNSFGHPADRNNWNPPVDRRTFNLLNKYDTSTPSAGHSPSPTTE